MNPSDTSPNADQNLVMYCPPPSHPYMRHSGRYAALIILTGLIAAILYPVFQTPYSFSGPYSSCAYNEKYIGMALAMYAQDNDETFPCGTRSNRRGPAVVRDTIPEAKYHVGQGWAGGLHPYQKQSGTFLCPDARRQMWHASQPNHRTVTQAAEDGTSDTLLSAISYAYNRNIALNTAVCGSAMPEQTILLSEVQDAFADLQGAGERNPENAYSPAGNGLTILASTDGATEAEAAGGVRYVTGLLGGYGHTSGCAFWSFYAPQAASRHGYSRRGEVGSIYLLADGHAKFFTPNQVSPGDNALAAQSGQDCAHHRAADTTHLNGFAVTFSTR